MKAQFEAFQLKTQFWAVNLTQKMRFRDWQKREPVDKLAVCIADAYGRHARTCVVNTEYYLTCVVRVPYAQLHKCQKSSSKK